MRLYDVEQSAQNLSDGKESEKQINKDQVSTRC